MSNLPSLPEKSSPVTAKPLFENCWSCRILSGGGLLASGGYVFMQARKVMHVGGPTSMGTVAQIVFAAGLAAWGVVVITDPVGKSSRKE
ncbi:distal membrane-arm assembly complex protein 1 [Pseudorasbora parva]|uniref:distal membrane-arm assembly complex protein 1 n=1 Tax=Pseudorasbora parva TaxID=51549 RepID=UPI00351E3270